MDKDVSANQQPDAPLRFDYLPPPPYTEIDSNRLLNESENLDLNLSEDLLVKELVDNKHIPDFSRMTEEEAHRALLVHIQQTKDSYLSFKAAQRIKITKLDFTYVHAYCLETYTQKRMASWEFTKYKQGRLNDQTIGRMPKIWEFEIADHLKPPMFEKHQDEFIIPFSEYLQACHNCSTAYRSCWTCSGNNKLKYYLKCKIIWQNYKISAFSEPSLIPKELLKDASGDFVFNQTAKTLNPINYIQNETITEASERLINSEKILLKSFKTLMQRHHVRLIPITKVYFTHGTKSNVYYIYGKEMKIYAPNFPKSTCVIM